MCRSRLHLLIRSLSLLLSVPRSNLLANSLLKLPASLMAKNVDFQRASTPTSSLVASMSSPCPSEGALPWQRRRNLRQRCLSATSALGYSISDYAISDDAISCCCGSNELIIHCFVEGEVDEQAVFFSITLWGDEPMILAPYMVAGDFTKVELGW